MAQPTGLTAPCDSCGAPIEVVVAIGGGGYDLRVAHREPICDDFRRHRDAADSEYALAIVRRVSFLPKHRR